MIAHLKRFAYGAPVAASGAAVIYFVPADFLLGAVVILLVYVFGALLEEWSA